jgi:hypothetical protein
MVEFWPVGAPMSLGHPPPWPTLGDAAPTWLRLTRAATEAEIGSVLWELASFNLIRASDDPALPPEADLARPAREIFSDLAAASELALPGGILVRDRVTGLEIGPGCCAGLEAWRAWEDVLASGESPWLGHDPSPYVESLDATRFRLWADGGAGNPVGGRQAIELSRSDLEMGLAAVERHLRAYSDLLAAFIAQVDSSSAEILVRQFERSFGLTRSGVT